MHFQNWHLEELQVGNVSAKNDLTTMSDYVVSNIQKHNY